MKRLFGHGRAVAAFREALDGRRLHHAWLLAGMEGIGKALFAEKAALRVLAQPPADDLPGLDAPDDQTAALVEAGSHPDFARLERLPKEDGGDLARNITVAQVRGLQRLFATTTSLSPWRVVLIDSIDDLEAGAANALLKNLEEPPPSTVFLLVSHAPDRLLPTIRSRCRILRLSPLDRGAMTSALRQALPDADESEIEAMVETGGGAPGRAVAHRGLDMASLEERLRQLADRGDPTGGLASSLAHSLSLRAAQPRYEAFLSRAPSFIAERARHRRGDELARALGAWEEAGRLAGAARRHSLDPFSIVFEICGRVAALAVAGEGKAA